PVRGADVVHEEAVDVANECLGVEVGGEQVRVPRPEAAVATDVEIPAVLRRDDAEVLALHLRAFTGATGHAGLDLVRRTKPAVAQLELDRETHRVLDAVATPGLADARLHRPQRLAVGMPRLEAGVDESPPDRRQLLDACAEHVDALSAGDLRIKVEVTRDLADDDELSRR